MKKKSLLYVLLIVGVLVFVSQKTYAYLISETNISVSSTGSNIKCDAEIQEVTASEKSIYGYAEFKVVVKNTEDNVLSGEPFDYTISFENETGSNAVFGYNNVFSPNPSITGSLANDQARTNSHIFQVKSNNGLSENINYKVKLNCTQKYQ